MAGEIPSYEEAPKDDQKPEAEEEASPKRNFGFLKNFEPVRYTLLEHPKEDPQPVDIDNSDYEIDDGQPKIKLTETDLDAQETFFPKIDNKISTEKKLKPKNGTRFIDIDIHTYKEMEFNLTAVRGNQRYYHHLERTTEKKDEDLLQDQLLEVKVRDGEAVYKNRLGVKPSTRTPDRYAPRLGKYRSEVRLGLDEARSAVPKP